MKKVILAASVAVLVMSACTKAGKSSDIVLMEEINMEHKTLNYESTVKENDAHSGKFYSSVDSIRQYGIGYSRILADSLKDRNLKVYISCWVREKESPFEGSIAIEVTTTKGIVSWNTIELKDKPTYKAGEWFEIKDSISFPSSLIKDAFTEVGVVALKNKGKDVFDMDDLQIKYKFSK